MPDHFVIKNKSLTMYEISCAAQSDVGLKREHNEDSFICYKPDDESLLASKGCVFVVADGMGGHAAGEVASKIAVDSIREAFETTDIDDADLFFRTVFPAVNDEIYKKSRHSRTLNGMGTTCTAMIIKEGLAFIAHVGDSRVYLIRGFEIRQLTEDHSLVCEMVKRGIIKKEQMREHPQRNVITRAMGFEKSVNVDIMTPPLALKSGDRLLLCSDGLSGMVTDEEIREVSSRFEPEEACNKLIRMANSMGGDDNVTLIIVKVE